MVAPEDAGSSPVGRAPARRPVLSPFAMVEEAFRHSLIPPRLRSGSFEFDTLLGQPASIRPNSLPS
jgi:hypothetical protein